MKSKNFVIIFLASLLVFVCVFNQSGTAKSGKDIAPAKIAVIDIEELMLKSSKNKRFEEGVNSDKTKAEAELKSLEDDIKALVKSLESLKPSSIDYAKRSNEVLKMEVNHQVKSKYYQQEFANRVLRWREYSFRSIMKEAGKVARAKGYDLVLSKQTNNRPVKFHEELMMNIQTTKIAYHSEELDITDDVMKAWEASN